MNVGFPTDFLWSIPLVSVRTFALMMAAPVFGHASVPLRVRVALSLLVALVVAPALPVAAGFESSPLSLAFVVGSEAMIGVTMGFALRLIFMAFAPLGELLSVQGGLAAANILDPSSGVSSVVLGVMFQAFALVVFLAVDGHHQVIRGLAVSYQQMPIASNLLSGALFANIAGLGATLFEVTARLAAPVTVVMLATNVGIGMLGRAIPQLNLMALQLPANVAIVLLILGLGAGPYADVVAQTLLRATDLALVSVLGGTP